MKKQEGLKLTKEVKISKNASVIPSYTKDLHKATQILKAGGIAIFPTDTVYGIGCRYDNKDSVSRLYRIKRTPKSQHFPILVSKTSQVKALAIITQSGQDLARKYWPGALTIILPSIIKDQTIGFRMPKSKLVLDLINKVGVSIIGTSANFHGRVAPRKFDQLDPEFVKLADFIIKGECQERIESTVVDVTTEPMRIIRKGVLRIRSV